MTQVAKLSGDLLGALRAAGDIAYIWDIASDRMEMHGDLDALFGDIRIQDGAGYNALVNVEDQPRHLAVLDRQAREGGRFDCEYRLRRGDGEFVWVHDRGSTETDTQGAPLRVTGLLRIVGDRKAAEEIGRERAVYDTLTGHYNQSRLRESLEHALSHARRYDSQGGYLVVGVDETIDDQAFAAAGQRLEQCLRNADLIGRLDGNRFGVVLSHCTEAGLAVAAAKVAAAMAVVDTQDGPVPLRVSAGGVMFPAAVKTVTSAMAAGDSAHIEARRRGAFTLYQPAADPLPPAREQADIGEALLAALREDRITLAYQPVVRRADGTTAYWETLLRIAGDWGDAVPASVFMPVAERLGYCQRIDRRVLELAVHDLTARPDLVLAVNISGLTVTDRAWFRRLSALVGLRPDIASRLIIEITETAALYDFEDAMRFVVRVRAFGCRVALDDFGAGHTNFRHLKTFPIDIVKIDGSFVHGIAKDAANQKFIDSLLDFTANFGLEIVAEGVESKADHDYLVKRGVTYLQGWMLGRPELGRPKIFTADRPPPTDLL